MRADAGSGRQALLDWNQLEAQREGRHCLLVVLHDEEGDTFRCDAWIGREEATGHDDVMRVAEPIEGVRPEALPGVLAGLLGSSVVVNRVKGDATPILVEVVLPVRAMLTAAEALTSEQSDVWNHHDIVMRWRDRIYARLRETPSVPPYVWEQRWRRRTDPTGRWVPFDQPSGPQKVAARKVFSASSSVALALSFHPNTCPHDRRMALLEEALAQGLPIVAWLADGAPTDADPRVPFEALKNSLPGDALKVFSKARLEWDPLSGDCSRHLVLIWDDPQHLPPDAYEDDLVPPPLVDETLR